ncbi:MAG TPA: acyl-CoA dehydrogenase family protein [Kofleriaceae bacterium]|jgi:alkylation response protein AidB-like acyl-CoA dehydrogenase|nr:acyl-CoA dehydrogenase family protein [Kofleriaceae bacterium]
MAFFQQPPRLANQFDDDPMLVSWIARFCPDLATELRELGDVAVEYHAKQLADRDHEPVLTQWDAWGQRIDRIEVSPLWREAQALAARTGMVAAGYEPRLGAHARTHQFAIVHLLGPSLDVYTCPLAMTDGAARTLLASGNQALMERYVPRLVSRDPASMWTSGQWMTERTGGSDVSHSETVARAEPGGGWRLYGTKWFTSATTSEIALTLARPEGNPDGSRGLALFLVELRDAAGRLRGIQVNRLKDKLGTRKVPTAELTLDGAPATLVGTTGEGVRAITPMLSVTRTWNAVSAASAMRRGLALAGDYARRRTAFGALLADKPLHADTLAAQEAEYAAAFCLAFRSAALLGGLEHAADGAADGEDARLSRVLIPIAKLTTAKQAVAVTSEAIEACGGAGYVEDTGLPRILADAQVLPIWEGTTNVLSLDTLRALGKGGAFEAIHAELERNLGAVTDPGLARPAEVARAALRHAVSWARSAQAEPERLEAGARRLALTLGRSLSLALLAGHAQWCLEHSPRHGPRAAAAARRFALTGVDLIADATADDTRLLTARP